MNEDRITYDQLSQLTAGRDRPAAHAIDNAARGVNAAERTIREIAGMIRAKLTEIGQRLDHGLSLNELGELQRMPADLDRAITLRQHHWQVLGALLTETEITSLQPAQAAPMDVQLYGSYTRRRYRAATSGEIERMLRAPRLDHRTCPPGRGGDVFIAPADDDEEFWSAWHARHPQPPVPAASITAEAVSLGRDAGKAAASWMFDGNTPEGAYRAVLRGIGDGDPAILDTHPIPGLSADGGYSEADLARDLGLDSGDQLPPDAVTAYLAAADQTFWDETERIAREHLAGTGLAVTGTEPGR